MKAEKYEIKKDKGLITAGELELIRIDHKSTRNLLYWKNYSTKS